MSDIQRILPLADVAINHELVDEQGYDPSAIAKTIHNANLSRRIHNQDVTEVVVRGTVMEVENPIYHNEPTPLHIRYVGSIMRYWTYSTDIPSDLPEYAYQTLGYEPNYIHELLTAQTDDPEVKKELDIKCELFGKVEKFIHDLPLSTLSKTILFLWGYFHDIGKVFRPYIKKTELVDGKIVIRKDSDGKTIKNKNHLNQFTTDFTPSESKEHEYLEKHTLSFLELFHERGMVNMQIYEGIRNLHDEYSRMSFLIKGESQFELPEEFTFLQKFALVALTADELGKGVIFRDKTGHDKRMRKLSQLKLLLERYL